MSTSKKKRNIKIGDIYFAHTFASVKVYQRVTKIENREKGIYVGVLLRDVDVEELIKAGVPLNKDDDPESCEGVLYDFQIIKKIRDFNKILKGDKLNRKVKPTGRRRIVRGTKKEKA